MSTVTAKDKPSPPSSFVRFTSGLLSATAAVTICSPIDVLKTRLITQEIHKNNSIRKYSELHKAFRDIFAQEGLRGFYRGYSITLVTTPMFHSLYFALYEKTKDVLLS